MALRDRVRRVLGIDQAAANTTQQIVLSDPDVWRASQPAPLGLSTTETQALRIAAVASCIAFVSRAVSSLPVSGWRNGTRLEGGNNVSRLIGREPWPGLTGVRFLALNVERMLVEGNGVNVIHRTVNGRVASIEPVTAWAVHSHDGRYVYRVALGPRGDDRRVLHADDVLHFSLGGSFPGVSPLKVAAANAVDIMQALERYTAGYFVSSMLSQVVLVGQSRWSDDQLRRVKQHFERQYATGLESRRFPLVVDKEVKVERLYSSATDAQLAELRESTRLEVAQAFGVPPLLAGATTAGSLDDANRQFREGLLSAIVASIVAEVRIKTGAEIHLDTSYLTRATAKERADANRASLGEPGKPGWKTINEIRREEGLPEIDDPIADKLNDGSQRPMAEDGPPSEDDDPPEPEGD